MAKKSVIYRNIKRNDLVDRMRETREELRTAIKDMSLSDEKRWECVIKLQLLPRDSSPSRRRNRCKLCGRPRAYNRLTGLCRLHMRSATIDGMVPGMRKSSW